MKYKPGDRITRWVTFSEPCYLRTGSKPCYLRTGNTFLFVTPPVQGESEAVREDVPESESEPHSGLRIVGGHDVRGIAVLEYTDLDIGGKHAEDRSYNLWRVITE